MYNTQEIAKRIKNIIKTKNEPLGTMLSNLEMGINTVSELGKGKQISYLNFAKIADYLDVSVDYLLGREEKNTTNITTANNSQIDNSTVIGVSNGKHYDETTNQVAEEFSKLSFSDKIKVMSLIAELNGNK